MPKARLFSKKKLPSYWIFFIFLACIAIVALAFTSMDSTTLGSKAVIIPIVGPISSYGDAGGLLASDSVSAQTIIQQIRQADEDPSVKAIIFEINSPGGTVVGSKEISAEIDKTSKPTIAWMREVAASGAYWIAASTDKIVADPATLTGSIGVTGSFLEFSGLMEKYGITYEEMTSGPYKETGSPFKEMTEAERALLQNKINALRDMFVKHIASHRDMSENAVLTLATGEVYLGQEAYDKGLVDVLGGKEEAEILAEEMTGMDLELYRYTRKMSLIERLTQSMTVSNYWVGRGIGDSITPEREVSVLAR
jgi:protease-4